VFTDLALDLSAGWLAAEGEAIDRERRQSKVIMMKSVTARRAWATVASPLKVVDGLFESLGGVLGCAFR
jgi:hypothetical protein